MKAIRRDAVTATALIAITLAGVPAIATGQCTADRLGRVPGAPNSQAPKLMVPTFHGDPALAVEFSKDVRDYIPKIMDPHKLWVVPCAAVNLMLTTSGFKPDSALSINDLGIMGRSVSARESLDGVVAKGPDGQIHVYARLYFENRTKNGEPLAPAAGTNLEAIARQVVAEYMEARKQFDGYQKCTYAIGDGKFDAAVVGGKEGIAAYPTAMLSRTCLLRAYGNLATVSPDTVIVLAKEILASDSTNLDALANLGDAYNKKGDKETALAVYQKLYSANPTQTVVAQTIVQILAQSGSPEKAIPIIDSLLVTNPNNPEFIDTKLKLQLHAGHWKEAFPTFDQLVKLDTAAGTEAAYRSIIGAAQMDSNPQLMAVYVTRAAQRFPKAGDLWMALSGYLKRDGKLQQALDAAKHAVEADPAQARTGIPYIMQLYAQLNQPDSAIAFARKVIAAGANRDSIGAGLIPLLTFAIQKPQDSVTNTMENWEAMLRLSATVDSVAPTNASKFFVGFSEISVGQKVLNEVALSMRDPGFDKVAACTRAATGIELVNAAYDAMATGGGGKYRPQDAGNILSGVTELRSLYDQLKKANPTCK